MHSAVSVKDLKINYGNHTVIEDLSIEVAPKEFLVLLGHPVAEIHIAQRHSRAAGHYRRRNLDFW